MTAKIAQTLHKLLTDWMSVAKEMDTESRVLVTPVPLAKDFHELDAAKIDTSVLKYLDTVKDDDGSIDFAESTTVEASFDAKAYASIYALYHDLKVASMIRMLEIEDDRFLYGKVDTFFRVATEMLLRECHRLKLTVEDDREKEREKQLKRKAKERLEKEEQQRKRRRRTRGQEDHEDDEQDEFDGEASLEELLTKDFESISTAFVDKTGESLSLVAAGSLPLFTSLNHNKSELDDREAVVDTNLSIGLVKVVPQLDSVAPEKLAYVSLPAQQPLRAANRILDQYIHPNWLHLTSTEWLNYGDNDANFSFAPSYDESRSTISNEWKGLTWLQEVGFEKVKEAKQKYAEVVQGAPKVEDKSEAVDEEEAKLDEVVEPKEQVDEADDGRKVDLFNLLRWNSGNKIDSPEQDAIKSNSVQAHISKLLLELNELRKSRITFQKEQIISQRKLLAEQAKQGIQVYGTGYRLVKASKEEVAKYHELKRLITGLISQKKLTPATLKVKHSTKLPVSQHNYNGTLPSSFAGSSGYSRVHRR